VRYLWFAPISRAVRQLCRCCQPCLSARCDAALSCLRSLRAPYVSLLGLSIRVTLFISAEEEVNELRGPVDQMYREMLQLRAAGASTSACSSLFGCSSTI
jgi:hypothetical protein